MSGIDKRKYHYANIMAVDKHKDYLNEKRYWVIFGWNREHDRHMLLGANIAGSFLVIHELNSERLRIISIFNT